MKDSLQHTAQQHWHKLDNEQRRILLPAKDILKRLDIARGMVLADVGCGIGYFALPAANMLGEEGKVFALDVSDTMLEELSKRVMAEGLSNVIPMKIEHEKNPLETNSVDIALLAFVLHEVNDPKTTLSEVHRVLLPKGRLAILEWDKKETPVGPPVNHRIDRAYVLDMLAETDFVDIREIAIGENYYGILAAKN
ncbi:methyltransferase domain-containing protein [Desulfosporosinus sp. PR]|uniref:class I SAM-dependent methyltransferase n=1 Tax=Candidatus Desulfosporosinus nitrosoreducens TaxID=3401928 RepID=UPI0027F3EE71|nr:methyltransferase domain-containing protein [Desulfosporosinus sp. PR]MDQ7093522.1 methyltransferase domain-containing protein [Desulfosporosinus sp. PR]